jgi:hypothetical protein
MKTNIRNVTGIIAAVALASATLPAQASIFSSTSSTSSWVGTTAYSTGAAPTTQSGGTTPDNDANWGGVANSGAYGFGSLAQTFTLATGGQLGSIQIVSSGGTGTTLGVSLYDLGSVASFNAGTAGVYPSVPGQLNFVPTTSSRSQVNLLNGSDTFTTAASGAAFLYTLTTDETINLLANEVYAIALDPTAAASGTYLWRGGYANANYAKGQAWNVDSTSYAFAYQNFQGKAGPYGASPDVNGQYTSGGGRNFDSAITLVAAPEPASMTLLGFGALVSTFIVRRKRA